MRLQAFALFFAVSAAAQYVPTLNSSAYIRSNFFPVGIATDGAGNLYLAGNSITDPGHYNPAAVRPDGQGVMIMKMNAQGTQVLYTRYVNGSLAESAGGIAVDAAGNASVVGATWSPDFPLTANGHLAASAPSSASSLPFVVKFDPAGNVLFSATVGSSGAGKAVAVAVDGGVVISGLSFNDGFSSTPGAYRVPSTSGRPFLMKIDPAAGKVVFSATGIGGSSLATDSKGNIYISGSTTLSDYPTTPGAYQTTLPLRRLVAIPDGMFSFPAPEQYVTKVDSAGSKLIYSTGLNAADLSGGTYNSSLTIDSAGNTYVAGTADTSPFAGSARTGYIAKLDPDGKALLYSVTIETGLHPFTPGPKLALDASGNLYAGGVWSASAYGAARPVSGLEALPAACAPNYFTAAMETFVSLLDSASGAVRATQLVDGSIVASAFLAIPASGPLWVTGFTSFPDVSTIPGSFFESLSFDYPGYRPGAYLSSVQFKVPVNPAANGAPTLGCIVDAATFAHPSAISHGQLLTIFGSNFDANTTVMFDNQPATMLYSSPTQMNVAAPKSIVGLPPVTVSVAANGATIAARQFMTSVANPALFADVSSTNGTCGPQVLTATLALVLNEDGTVNSCTNPAKGGTRVSAYLNGWQYADGSGISVGGFDSSAVSGSLVTDYVMKLQIRMPTGASSVSYRPIDVLWNGVHVGPQWLHDLAFGGVVPGIAGTPGPKTNFSAIAWYQ